MNLPGNLRLSPKMLIVGGSVLVLIAVYAAERPQAEGMREVSSLMNEAGIPQPAQGASARRDGTHEVQLLDHGLNMVRGTVRIPGNWSVIQDIAFDPQAGKHTRFKLVTVGPRNQYIRSYNSTFPWGNIHQISFDDAVRQAIDHVIAIERLENIRFSQLIPSERLFRDPRVREMAQRIAGTGQRFESYDIELAGTRDGRDYRGRITFGNFNNPHGGFGILQPNSMIFGLAEDFEELERVAEQIQESLVPNPAYTHAMERINQQVRQRIDAYGRQQMQQSAIAHQKRMLDRQAAFHSHQRNMAGLNQIQDAAHESYMKTLRSNGTFNSIGSDASSHDRFIDQIHERSTFLDPWAEKQISLDGQYDYNYTNGLGDYYRTNDPSFDPASLQGDWKLIEPLQ